MAHEVHELHTRPDDTPARPAGDHISGSILSERRATSTRRFAAVRAYWRVVALLAMTALALPLYERINHVSGTFLSQPRTLLWPLLGLALIYIGGCFAVTAGAPRSRRVALVELGALLLAGVAFRAVVFGTPPLLSHDAYRYAWDPYLLAHGVSPYVHAPNDPLLAPLRDGSIWPNLNWRDAPTIYPPGAQAFFFVMYLVKPLSIWAVKWAITSADAVVALLLLTLLRRRGMDTRLVLLYWWSPIAVIEFAGNAHLDVVAVAWALLALLLADGEWRGARFAAGVALAMATLTKLYPLLFVLAIARRRDRGLYAGLVGTLILGYLPVLVSGSHSTGFLATYVGQRFPDEGIVVVAISKLVGLLGGGDAVIIVAQVVAALVLCGAVVVWRIRRAPSPEAAMLALTALYFALAPHTFPWYVAIVLPLVALLWKSTPWRRRATPLLARRRDHVRAFSPVFCVWLFALWIPFTYVIFAPGGQASLFAWLSLATMLVGAFPWIMDPRRDASLRPAFRLTPLTSERGPGGEVRSKRRRRAG